MQLQKQLDAAAQIAREAGEILLSYSGSDRIDVQTKGLRDVVTAADFSAEKHILSRLRDQFAGDGVVAEEGGAVESESGRRWYVDPLDGTVNYSRGIPIWCVSMALMEGGKPVLGVVYDPIRDEMFTAVSGHGARCNGLLIRCSNPDSLSATYVHVTIDFNQSSMLEGIDDITAVAPRVLRTRNIGSAALALAYVAAGRFDAMLHRYANTWDYAGGVALIAEAGGVVSDMEGRPFSETSVTMVAAANEKVHSGLLDLLRTQASTRIE
jgi:myo-inositol-1(or 4)-monophosphatase